MELGPVITIHPSAIRDEPPLGVVGHDRAAL
jgi:hypothetical protein